MSSDGIPPLEPLAPIVDQMRELARDELPSPRSCKVRLWDDGTFDVVIYHSMRDDEMQFLRYERTTSEIYWAYVSGTRWESESLTGNETVHEATHDEVDVRVLSQVEPPYK